MYTAIFALVAALVSVILMMVFGGSASTGGLILIVGLVSGMAADDVVGRRAAKQAQG